MNWEVWADDNITTPVLDAAVFADARGLPAAAHPAFGNLRDRYFARQVALHGDCFYTGLREPITDTELLIHQTIYYIRDAEELARRRPPASAVSPPHRG